MKIKIGTYSDTGKPFYLDLNKLVETRMLICANSGSGKSYLIRKICEEAYGKVMIIILDIEGEFYTLREKYDFLLVGGKNNDVNINIQAAELLPRKLTELKVSTIIDMSDMKKHDRILYVKNFLKAMMELPKELYMPVIIMVGEAHNFAGEQEKQESTWAVIDLMTRGRKRGYMGGLDTQRISKLHKDAAAEASNYFVGRTFLDLDMKRAADIIGLPQKEKLKLRDLEDGEFWAFGRAMSHKDMRKVKIDKAKTTHPKVGSKINVKLAKPTKGMQRMLEKLSDLPKEVEQEKKEKSDLQKEIRELKIQLKSQPKNIATKFVDDLKKDDYKKGYEQYKKDTIYKNLLQLENNYKKQLNDVIQVNNKLSKKITDAAHILGAKVEIPKLNPIQIPKIDTYTHKSTSFEKPVSTHIQPFPDIRRTSRPERSVTETGEADEGNVKTLRIVCSRKIYKFLYSNPDRSFTMVQIATMTGYAISGGFRNCIYALNSSGLIIKNGEDVQINGSATMRGEEFYGSYLDKPENFWDRTNILSKLGKCERTILEYMYENPEDTISMEDLANNTKYNISGGFRNSIYKLNSLQLINHNKGIIKLSEDAKELVLHSLSW